MINKPRRCGPIASLLLIPLALLTEGATFAQQSPFVELAAEDRPEPAEVDDVIEAIEFRGTRRMPQDMLRAKIFSAPGDRHDEATIRRDFIQLWNTGRFDDIRVTRTKGAAGWIVRFTVAERPTIASIDYEGLHSLPVSEVLERLQQRRVGLTVASPYEPERIQRAAVVLEAFLAERGRQFATVNTEVESVPPSSLGVTFRVDEGPRVRVGDITIEGNSAFGDQELIRSMRLLKPVGIPHSLLLENLFSRAYDEEKLLVDRELLREFYQQRGYYRGTTPEHEVTLRDVGGGKFRVPLIYPNRPGKKADIKITLQEGRRYYLNDVRFEGVREFREMEPLLRPLFGMEQGDVFSTAKLHIGLDNLRKLYGRFGYIDFVAEPYPEPVPDSNQLDLLLSIDEGKQFFVRRIEFSGNTTTRDKVIRRELLLNEGYLLDADALELSILRLNQLGFFEPLDANSDVQMRRDTQSSTVDLTVNVREQGKNRVQMSGGVSGIAGSFLSFGYSTNNFLGLGETLSIESQLGDRLQSVMFGFTEPYLFGRPIQSGFTVSTSRFDFDEGREANILAGGNLAPLFGSLDP